MQTPAPRSRHAQPSDRRHTFWIALISVVLLSGPVVGVVAGQSTADTLPSDEPWTQDAKLKPPDPQPNDWAGFAVDLDGGIAAVGAPVDNDARRPGHVFFFEGTNGEWVHVAGLEGSQSGDRFGDSLDLEGDTIAVGAPRGDTPETGFAGAVYLYERGSTGSWVQTDLLAGQDSALGDEFGTSVDLKGDRLLVGARSAEPHGLTREGAAYLFERTSDGWEQQAKLIPSAPGFQARFGDQVALDGDTVLIGAHLNREEGRNAGAAFIFELVGGEWTETAHLRPSNPGVSPQFGAAVALEGSTAMVGAPGGPGSDHPGAVHIFERGPEGPWIGVARLVGDDDPEAAFGGSIDFEGDRAVIGDATSDDLDLPDLPFMPSHEPLVGSGAAFVYERVAGAWDLVAKVVADDRATLGPVSTEDGAPGWDFDHFGFDVALDGDHLLIGAVGDDTGAGDDTGSAYVYSPGCKGTSAPVLVSPPVPPCLEPGG